MSKDQIRQILEDMLNEVNIKRAVDLLSALGQGECDLPCIHCGKPPNTPSPKPEKEPRKECEHDWEYTSPPHRNQRCLICGIKRIEPEPKLSNDELRVILKSGSIDDIGAVLILGYSTKENSNKVVDVTLVQAMAKEMYDRGYHFHEDIDCRNCNQEILGKENQIKETPKRIEELATFGDNDFCRIKFGVLNDKINELVRAHNEKTNS